MSAPAAQRTELLDALRGFALFGVAWSNYAVFAYWIFLSEEAMASLPGAWLDEPLEVFHNVFIDGKFYSIFSLLFGIGFGFFLEKGNDGVARFIRRLLILLGIGWLHIRYLWAGDILFLYAALGLLLPLFRKVSERALLITAAALLLVPIGIDAAQVLTHGGFDPARAMHALVHARDAELGSNVFEDMVKAPGGGLAEFNAAASRSWLFRFEDLVQSSRLPKVLGLFLLGLWVARRKLFADPSGHRALLKRSCIVGVAVGLPFSILRWWSETHLEHLPDAHGLLATIGYALGVVPLAIAYASGFALLWTSDHSRRWLQLLAPMGRMALTNYLMQTVLGIVLFAGVGLGWGMRVSAVGFESIALGVYILEVCWSLWWLKRFRFGPMEWAWRSLTYGKVMPMRK